MQAAKQVVHQKSRDISYFIKMRPANWRDDAPLADLLVEAFVETYKTKLPRVETNDDRIRELRDVPTRRVSGETYVLELGYRLIGSFTLIYPNHPNTQSWRENTANLRCLAVHPEFHGLALSEMMLNKVMDLAQQWLCDGICLHVQQGALGVARIYEKRGFVRAPEGDVISHGNCIEAYYLPFTFSSNVS